MQPVIRIDRLSKRYLIRHEGAQRYLALRDVVMDSFRRVASPTGQALRSEGQKRAVASIEEFWALKDVSFEVKRGDVVGIIGRNGAGKSTLLKILSRITEPTEGRVELNGRIASLLEVGTGFHPELTGRENIFLNGAILGMSGSEIKRKFDEIAAFAEVEKFLDTPVKRYSSGMYVRLAFSVAAHLEPEVLLVDEVLAVGDAEFQKKCLGKMQEVSKGGRTVIFVSHNMAAVQALCSVAVYLVSGRVRAMGNVDELVNDYVVDSKTQGGHRLQGPVRVSEAVTLLACELGPNPVQSGGEVDFRIELVSEASVRLSELALLLYTQKGFRVAVLDFRSSGLPATLAPNKPWELRGKVRSLPLVEGDYSAGLYINVGDFTGDLFDLVGLSVSPLNPSTDHAPYPAVHRGLLNLEFRVEAAQS